MKRQTASIPWIIGAILVVTLTADELAAERTMASVPEENSKAETSEVRNLAKRLQAADAQWVQRKIEEDPLSLPEPASFTYCRNTSEGRRVYADKDLSFTFSTPKRWKSIKQNLSAYDLWVFYENRRQKRNRIDALTVSNITHALKAKSIDVDVEHAYKACRARMLVVGAIYKSCALHELPNGYFYFETIYRSGFPDDEFYLRSHAWSLFNIEKGEIVNIVHSIPLNHKDPMTQLAVGASIFNSICFL